MHLGADNKALVRNSDLHGRHIYFGRKERAAGYVGDHVATNHVVALDSSALSIARVAGFWLNKRLILTRCPFVPAGGQVKGKMCLPGSWK
jgi:hypothetical protein